MYILYFALLCIILHVKSCPYDLHTFWDRKYNWWIRNASWIFKTTGNTPTSSWNEFYDEYNGSSGTYVNVNGRLEEVAYQVHTHPFVSNDYDNPLLISDKDISMADRRFGGTVHVLVPPGDYYKVHTNQLNAFEGPVNW